MTPLIVGLVVLGLLGLLVLTSSFRRRDTDSAIGQLSGETVKRDRGKSLVGAGSAGGSSSGGTVDEAAAATGKEVEALAKADRSGSLVKSPSSVPAVYVPPDPETLGVQRRQFLNRGITAMFGIGLAGFGAGVVGFLWPSGGGGFGSKITVGRVSDVAQAVSDNGNFFYVPEGRMWITKYPAQALSKAQGAYSFYSQVEQGLQAGLTALYQTCPHLGCRVPECATSQWFECPCHGSQYNIVGEKKAGPAPRGMDRFPMEVSPGGELLVDTGIVIQGPPVGINTTGQEAEGPHCISGGH